MDKTQDHLVLYTIQECAYILRVNRSTVSRLLKENRIIHLKIGSRKMIRKSDLEAFLDNQIVNIPGGIRSSQGLTVFEGERV
jgi:excisionase family DNA binding protein